NDIDLRFLGFDQGDAGLVAFRSYDRAEKIKIIKNIQSAGLTTEQRAIALDRANTRFREADKYLSKIEHFAADGEIDVGFNYRGNGIDLDNTTNVRKFALDSSKVEGGTYYRPLQESTLVKPGAPLPKWCREGLGAVLCRVTGDMDGVYMTNV